MVPEEGASAHFVDLASGDTHDEFVDHSLVCRQRIAVQDQERARSNDCRPLVAIDECMVLGQAEEIGGRQFFENNVLPCSRCHKVNGEGGEAGPDLTLIGKEKSKEYLLESIIKPNAHIAAGFDVATFTLKNGDTETGSLASESPTQIVLRRADNTTVNIDPKQVKQRVTAPSSMPEIYAQVLTRAQLRDLVAFMAVLTHAQRNPGEETFGKSNRAMGSVTQESSAGGHP